MTPRVARLGLTAIAALAVVASSLVHLPPVIVWNVTASAPLGLYLILPPRGLTVGQLVLLRLDPAIAAAFAARGYVPAGVPLLKHLAALPGTAVCAHDGAVFIAGRHAADAPSRDGAGRPLAAWTGCRVLAGGEVFVLNPDVPGSLDGRYFGPTPVAAVIGRAVPIWTHRGR